MTPLAFQRPALRDPATLDRGASPPGPRSRDWSRTVLTWWRAVSLVRRVAAVTVALTVVLGAVVAQVCSAVVLRTALDEEASRVAGVVSDMLGTWLTPEDLGRPLSPPRYAEVDRRIREGVRGVGTVGVNLWRVNRTTVYSTDPRAVSRPPREDDELDRALSGEVEREMTAASATDISLEPVLGDDVMEIYVPLRLSGGPVVGALELYRDPADVQARAAAVQRALVLSLALGLSLFLVVILLVVRGASLQLGRQSVQLAGVSAHEELTRRQTEFVAVVSHELRTPLAALVGFSELLLDPRVDAGDRQDLTRMLHNGAFRLQHLVDQLLDLSRLDLDEITVRVRPTSLAAAVAQALESVADAPGHDISCRVPPDLPPVVADPDRLVQVLVNLVSNAVKYSPAGGRIDVAAHAVGPAVHLVVSDEGLGIPEAELPTVFDRFRRVDSDDRRSIEGTGLGLYITRRLVELQGGNITARNRSTGGSVFVVTLTSTHRGADA